MTRALTLHQPWASLVAVGAKTIETRSWPTSYRGPLLIHAGKRGLRVGGVRLGDWFACTTITDPAYQRPLRVNPATGRTERVPKRAQSPTLFWPHAGKPGYRPREGDPRDDKGNPRYSHTETLPLGAVVASCQLVDCVSTDSLYWTQLAWKGWGWQGFQGEISRTIDPAYRDKSHVVVNVDEQPFGDFTPGRWAWLLEDVQPTTERCPRCWGGKPIRGYIEHEVVKDTPSHYEAKIGACPICAGAGSCAPVPMRGRQRLFTPEWPA